MSSSCLSTERDKHLEFSEAMRIVIINGPNLNLLGKREPGIYGTCSMEQVLLDIQRKHMDVHFTYLQSNHEGDLIDWMQRYGLASSEDKEVVGIVLNAGGYTHTSVALRDAVTCAEVPVVEVHISDIAKREAFRRNSLLTEVCAHSVIGKGTGGYLEAVDWIIHNRN